jgi:glutaminyl-tRNA synthetase
VQVIDNLEDGHSEEVKALRFPGRSEEGYTVPFTKVCYIEASDFRESDSKDYYGLAPGKSVMLRHASDSSTACSVHSVPCTSFGDAL